MNLKVTLLFIFFVNFYFAQSISGIVKDNITGEAVVGAKVEIEGNNQKTVVKLDGTFILKKIPPGSYTLKISSPNYAKQEEQISVLENQNTKVEVLLHAKNEKSIETVLIIGNRESDRNIQNIEKNSDQLKNIVSSKNIELMPDITVANVLQRVSGVNIDRNNSGEGRYPVIRGMDKRFNSTLVNGIKIPSPDNKNRYVPLDLFPSEILERLEVIKSLTPDMEGDAIGGTINLVMKDAPSRELLQINSSEGFSTIFTKNNPFLSFNHSVINKKSPSELYGEDYHAVSSDFPRANLSYTNRNMPLNYNFGLTYGNRIGKNKKFGFLLAGSYQKNYTGSSSIFVKPNAEPNAGNEPTFSDILIRNYSTESARLALNAKLDYRFNSKNKISLFNLYTTLDQYQARHTVDSIFAIQRTGPGSGNVQIFERTFRQLQHIYNTTLQGDHQLTNKLKFDWSAVYSRAKNELPDWAEYSSLHAVYQNQSVTADQLQGMERQWTRNTDQDLSGYINFTYAPEFFGRKSSFKLGGMYRRKNRNNYFNSYSFSAILNPDGSPQVFTNIFDAQYGFKGTNTGLAGDQGANNYTFDEDIAAGYLMGKISLTDKLEVLGGLRIESTQDKYNTLAGDTFDYKDGRISYNDALPSAQIKYEINNHQNIRASYYKAISRPGFSDIVPLRIIGDVYDEVGNPFIKRTQSSNYDLRYSYLSGVANQFLVGAFYKNIINPIETTVQHLGNLPGNVVLTPSNFGTSVNYGLEVVYSKYFGNLGFLANYTYTHSEITTNKLQQTSSNLPEIVQQKRPLQGQAEHIGNLSLIYKNPILGINTQIALVYTGQRIAQVSAFKDLDYWQKAYTKLDFSLEKIFAKKFSCFVKINNLTNSPYELFLKQPNIYRSGKGILPIQDSDNRINVQRDYYKPSFLLGVRFKM